MARPLARGALIQQAVKHFDGTTVATESLDGFRYSNNRQALNSCGACNSVAWDHLSRAILPLLSELAKDYHISGFIE
jgi:hypothetical protein